jgi:hypothetical protein
MLALAFAAAWFVLSGSAVDAAHTSATKAAPSPKAIFAATKKAMATEKSVHCVIVEYDSSTKVTSTVTLDTGTNRGLESLVVGTAKVNLRLTSSAAFLSGNSAGLKLVFGLSTAQIKEVGKKWIFAAKGTSQYTDVKDAVTIKPLLASLLPTKSKVTLAAGQVDGRAAHVLKWSTTSSKKTTHYTLDIAASGPSLPIQLMAIEGKSFGTGTFSRWGESVAVPVPTATVTL